MAHHNNQPRTLRSPHNLQDERLFSLSGGIPSEHFDELNYGSTRRGQHVALPAPTGDLWGYYAEQGRARQAGTARTSPVPSP